MASGSSGPKIRVGVEVAAQDGINQARKMFTEIEHLKKKFGTLKPKNMTDSEFKTVLKNAVKEVDKYEAAIKKSGAAVDLQKKKWQEAQKILKRQKVTYDELKTAVATYQAKLNSTNVGTKTWEKTAEGLKVLKARLKEVQTATNEATNAAVSGSKKTQTAVNATNTALSTQHGFLGRLITRLAAYTSIYAVLNFAKKVRDVTAEFELQKTALGAILQDTYKAGKLFNQIKSKALESPFEIKDLTSYTKQLAAYHIEEEKLFDTTMRLGDLSAGLGVDMQRLILAFGQVKSAAVLRGQELRQFTEAGIPMVQALADKFTELRGQTVKTAEVFDLISKRAVSFQMVEEVLNDMTNAGGMFYEMQEKQAKTLKGQITNLKDAFSLMYDEMGRSEPFNTVMRDSISILRTMAKHWREIATVVKGALVAYTAVKVVQQANILFEKNMALALKAETIAINEQTVAEYRLAASKSKSVLATKAMLAPLVKNTTLKKLSAWQTNALAAAELRAAKSTNVLTLGINRLTLALLKNPYTAAAAAVLALVFAFSSLKKEVKTVEEMTDDLQTSTQNYLDGIKKTKELDDAIDKYDELAKKENKTAAETKKLSALTKDLASAFPGAVDGLNSQKDSVVLLTDKMRTLNEETKKTLKNVLQLKVSNMENEVQQRQQLIDGWNNGGKMYKTREGWLNKIWGGLIGRPTQKVRDEAEYGELFMNYFNETQNLVTALDEAKEALEGLNKEVENTSTLSAWQENISSSSYKKAGLDVRVYTKDIIETFDDLDSALDDVAKKWKEANESAEQYKKSAKAAAVKNDAGLLANVQSEAEDAENLAKYLGEILTFYDAWDKTKTKSERLGPKANNKAIKEEYQLVLDIYKKYQDLLKTMHATDAKRVIEETYGPLTEIDFLNPEDLKLRLARILGKVNRSAKDALDITGDISKAIQDVDYNELLRTITDRMKMLSENISRTKEARNFFTDMLGITGNKTLSSQLAEALFGSDGKELENLIQQQLTTAFTDADLVNVTPARKKDFGDNYKEKISAAIIKRDWVTLTQMLDLLPEKSRAVAEEIVKNGLDADKKWLLDMEKTYAKTKTFAERRQIINDKESEKYKEIDEKEKKGILSPDEAETLRTSVLQKTTQELANLDIEILKANEDWEKAFGNLDRVGKTTLGNILDLIDQTIEKYRQAGTDAQSGLTPEQLKTLEEAREKIIGQMEKRSPVASFVSGFAEYVDASKNIAIYRKELKKATKGTKEFETAQKNLKKAENAQREGLDKMHDALDNMGNQLSGVSQAASSLSEALSAIGMKDDSDTQAMLQGIQQGIALISAGLTFVNGMLTLIETHPILLIAAAISAAVMAISNIKTNRANKEIKEQEAVVKRLEYAYKRLGEQLEKTFGSEYIYNYNQSLKSLQAKAEAYRKQAEAEASKGKKSDDSKVEDYKMSQQEALDEIEKLQEQMTSKLAGSDLASAARSFAEAWIEAYKEFGSTTEAMKEKFHDMIQNMIVETAAAKIMQSILAPMYDQLSEMAESGGELTYEEMTQWADELVSKIPEINDGMSVLMNKLAASGYNVRQSASSLSGISKDIASASEESILGLASGINTQNFYISQTNDYVFQILTILQAGGIAAASPAMAAASEVGSESYLSYLPTIADNTSQIVRQCEIAVEACQSIATDVKRVVQPKGTVGSHWVVTN